MMSNICARCAQEKAETCCHVPTGQKLATLTFCDMERIEAATGLLRPRFVEKEELDPMERLAYETFRPIYHGVFAGNIRFGLKVRRGACVFLDRIQGCTLPLEAKPLACHLYPFDFDPWGNITIVDAPHCLALELAQSGRALLHLFHVSQKKLFQLRAQALREGAAHAQQLAFKAKPHSKLAPQLDSND